MFEMNLEMYKLDGHACVLLQYTKMNTNECALEVKNALASHAISSR